MPLDGERDCSGTKSPLHERAHLGKAPEADRLGKMHNDGRVSVAPLRDASDRSQRNFKRLIERKCRNGRETSPLLPFNRPQTISKFGEGSRRRNRFGRSFPPIAAHPPAPTLAAAQRLLPTPFARLPKARVVVGCVHRVALHARADGSRAPLGGLSRGRLMKGVSWRVKPSRPARPPTAPAPCRPPSDFAARPWRSRSWRMCRACGRD